MFGFLVEEEKRDGGVCSVFDIGEFWEDLFL